MYLLNNLTIITVLTSAFIACLTTLIAYYKWCFTYWSKRNVPIFKQPKIPFGTVNGSLKNIKHIGVECKKAYDILRKEREFYFNERDDPLSANLFAVSGKKWKIFRKQLSPAFTSRKIKMMFDNILCCSNQLIDAVKKSCKSQKIVDVEDVTESFTIDVIGSCSFGLECNSFKNPNAEFKRQGRRAFHMNPLRIFKIFLGFFCPEIARFLGVTLFDKESNNSFVNVVKDTINYRTNNNIHRKDVLQLLFDSRTQQKLKGEDKILTLEEITAQVFIFFAAGFEPSSITLTFCLYELSLNSDVQKKIRNEINQVLKLHGGNITYEAIMHMKYLELVVNETLRKYPPLPYISRRCVEDYTIPNTSIKIEKGIEVVISILGLHHDPEYYPEPEKFIPERFSEEEKLKRVPFTYLPFGEGPRICIGKRLGLLQTKVGLVALLKHFKFSLNEKTRTPLEMKTYSFNLMPKSGIFLNVSEVKDNE